jgi:hypothetical protein
MSTELETAPERNYASVRSLLVFVEERAGLVRILDRNTKLYRARTKRDSRALEKKARDSPARKLGPAPTERVTAGRMNAEGVPMVDQSAARRNRVPVTCARRRNKRCPVLRRPEVVRAAGPPVIPLHGRPAGNRAWPPGAGLHHRPENSAAVSSEVRVDRRVPVRLGVHGYDPAWWQCRNWPR